MSRRLLLVASVVATLAAALPAGAATTTNMRLIERVALTGLTEIAHAGDQLYVGELNGVTGRDQSGYATKGGIRVFDLLDQETGARQVKATGFLRCAGNDNDVVVLRPGLVAFAHHKSTCGAKSNGIALADVSDPARPKVLGGVAVASAHTLTPMPGTNYIYVSPGGLANGNGATSIVDVSDPTKPRVAATFTPNPTGCHDLQFQRAGTRSLAFCAGGGSEVQTWDVSDPLAPRTIGRIVNPAIQFPHNAVPSPDGKLLVVNDEAFAAHECSTGTSVAGSLWIYDITDPATPLLAGRVAPPTSSAGYNVMGGTDKWCTAHNYDFVPGTRTLVAAWFTGGTTVEDLTNPLQPARIGSYQPADANAYSADWYDGRLYIADMKRGLEVLEVDGVVEP